MKSNLRKQENRKKRRLEILNKNLIYLQPPDIKINCFSLDQLVFLNIIFFLGFSNLSSFFFIFLRFFSAFSNLSISFALLCILLTCFLFHTRHCCCKIMKSGFYTLRCIIITKIICADMQFI